MIRLPAAYWLLGLCAAWLLPGLIGHAPWKGPDAETFARLLAAREQSDWLFPAPSSDGAGAFPLYYWLAQTSAELFSPFLPLHDAVRLASGIFAALALGLTALTARRLYGQETGWLAALALLGCMGLLVPVHEINPYTAQLAAAALFVYGLARMLQQPLLGGGLAGLGLAGLLLSGAWLEALVLASALLILPILFPSWRTSSRIGGSWFALTVLFALSVMWLLSVQHAYPERFVAGWRQAVEGLVFLGTPAKYNPLYFVNALTWFAWPAWPLAGWAVYRLRRGGWDTANLWMPLGVFLVTLLALSLRTGTEQLQAIILLPPLALLASAGLIDLRRGAANALLWFSIMVFSFFGLLFWVYWSALDVGWPAQMARRLVKLGMDSDGLRPLALTFGLVVTAAWIGWLTWLKRQPRQPQRPVLVWAAGMTFVWCLLSALFLRPLDARLSYSGMAQRVNEVAAKADCLNTKNLNALQIRLLAYHTGKALKPGQDCDWLLVYRKSRKEAAPGAGWAKRWEGARPGDRNERFWLYQKRG